MLISSVHFVFILLQRVLFSHVVAFDSDKVTKMLQKSLDCHGTPAMAVSVVRDGKTVYSKGFGYTDLQKKTPVTQDTLFGIASISKSFAAALLVKLLHQKTNLTLDSKVRDLLGDQFVMPDELRTRETTFLDLLAHKTGLLANNRIRYDDKFNRDTLLSRLRYLPSPKQFRVDYIYSNLMYGLVGRLAEIIDGTGKRWEQLVEEHFYKPLGMDKSTFLTTMDYRRNDYARGFMERDGPDKPEMITPMFSQKWAEVCASGSVVSTAKDMTKWMNFHLQDGKNSKAETVMSKDIVDELHTQRFLISRIKYLDIKSPQFPITSYSKGYALGLRVGQYRGIDQIAHTGTTFGYSAVMAMLPSKKIGVLMVINNSDRYYRQRASVEQYLMDSALGFEPYLNESTMCTYPVPWVKEQDMSFYYRPKRSKTPQRFYASEYEGTYTDTAYGKMEVKYDPDLNSPVMTYGWGRWELMVWPKRGMKEQRLYGKAIAPVFPGDLSTMFFLAHPDNKDVVVGFKADAMERKRPPIFCKQGQVKACQDIIKKMYPEEANLKTEKLVGGNCLGNAVSISQCKIRQISIILPIIVIVVSLITKCKLIMIN